MTIIKQTQVVVWLQEAGPFSAYIPYATGEGRAGASGKSIPVVTLAPEFGVDNQGQPTLLAQNETPPGDFPGMTLAVYDRELLTILEKVYHDRRVVNVQLRKVNCGTLDNPNQWSKISIYPGGTLTTLTPGDGPSPAFNGETMQQQGQFSFTDYYVLARTGLSDLSTTEINNLLSIAGIPDNPPDCGVGYPGADQILYVGTATDGLAPSALLFSNDGGSTWAATANAPLAANDGHSVVLARIVGEDTVRAVVFSDAAPGWAYGDAIFGDEGGMTWTEVSIAAGAASGIEAAFWPSHRRGYVANAGDIYIVTNQWTADPGAASFTGANAINAFALGPDGRTVWAVGVANVILREQNENGIFAARTGPSGGGAFHSIAIADDGTIFAGNGQFIYRNRNAAANTGGWEQLYDFGASHLVSKIQIVRGDSQVIRAVVDDTTPGDGEVWESVDGGESWRQITLRPNDGYNDAYFSETDPNAAVIVGDADATPLGTIHQLAP